MWKAIIFSSFSACACYGRYAVPVESLAHASRKDHSAETPSRALINLIALRPSDSAFQALGFLRNGKGAYNAKSSAPIKARMMQFDENGELVGKELKEYTADEIQALERKLERMRIVKEEQERKAAEESKKSEADIVNERLTRIYRPDLFEQNPNQWEAWGTEGKWFFGQPLNRENQIKLIGGIVGLLIFSQIPIGRDELDPYISYGTVADTESPRQIKRRAFSKDSEYANMSPEQMAEKMKAVYGETDEFGGYSGYVAEPSASSPLSAAPAQTFQGLTEDASQPKIDQAGSTLSPIGSQTLQAPSAEFAKRFSDSGRSSDGAITR